MAGLALSRLTLSHFRSYKSAHLDVDRRPLAFFGANGVGKTNILEAVSLFSPGRGIRRAGAEELSRNPENLGWKLTACIDAPGRSHEIETWSEPSSGRQVRIDDKATSQTALGAILRMVWLVPSMDRLWQEGAEARRRFLDRMTLSFQPDHAEQALSYEKAMRERNRLLKDNVSDTAWYRALEARMAASGAVIWSNRRAALDRLTAAQAGADTAFPTANLSLVSSDGDQPPENEADLIRALADSRPRDLQAGRALVGPHRLDLHAIYAAKSIEARLCSTGEQKALLISLVLANARALASEYVAPVILLDEVAAHLDPDRRAALYDEICALDAQAWLTGTEAMLFDSLGDRARQFEVSETPAGSRITERN